MVRTPSNPLRRRRSVDLRPVHATLRDSNPGTACHTPLTSGYAPSAAQPSHWPHPPIAQPARTRRNVATREYAPSYAVYEGAYVDLSGQLSNPQPALCRLADQEIGTPESPVPKKAQPAGRIPRPKSRTARPLKPAEIDALIAGYRMGSTMKALAAEFGIDRRTVSAYLRRAEIAVRRGGLDQKQAIEAARLYEAAGRRVGWPRGSR
jgi:hypothetical protein